MGLIAHLVCNLMQLERGSHLLVRWALDSRKASLFSARRSDESRNAANGRGDLALCDLGMGPLSCFVTMKPLSCDYLAPISADRHEEQVSRQARDRARGVW